MVCAIVLLVVMAVVYGRDTTAEAISGADFDAGYIISDERFFDNGSMAEANVQQFLSAQVPRCASVDFALPCLPLLVTSTNSRPAAPNGCAGYASEGWESAAHILYKVAQSCRINPQVLLVMLQKEQGLVTSVKPTARQYAAAMGANCPDTAPCAPTTLGFFNQVYTAAWQMRQYTAYPRSWRHHIGDTSVSFSPNSSCGTSVVYIRNQATANLYNYTPYQPNAAALANLYGGGDGCSSYGNRNFWRIFSTWFGSTTATGTTAIDTIYNGLGGAGGILGLPTTDYIPLSTASGAGTGRAYAGGSIYWSPRTGAAAVVEPFRATYFGYGGATGIFGWPNSPSVTIPGNAGGAGQSFEFASIYTSDSTGVHSVRGTVRAAYFSMGGAVGWLGWPTSEQSTITVPAAGVLQTFEEGQIAIGPTGTFTMPAAIGARWNGSGAIDPAVGWPVTPGYTYEANGGGLGQAFQGGAIYASPAGAFFVSGPTRDVYFTTGGAVGWLGWPTGELSCATVCWQSFQSASILSDRAGTRIADPRIEQVHASSGGDAGPQGARLTGLVQTPENGGGFGQLYQNASIYSSPAGAFAVAGAIRDYYWSQSGAAGPLGFPASSQVCTPQGVCSQSFVGGSIFSTAATGAVVSTAAIFDVYVANGGLQGILGRPTTWAVPIAANGGGMGQAFVGGSVYSSAAGTFAVTPPLRDGYFVGGGAAGSLGWPKSLMSCVADGSCTQAFQGGVLSWHPTDGYTVH